MMTNYAHRVILVTALGLLTSAALAVTYQRLPPNGQAMVEWFAAFLALVLASVGLLCLPAARRKRQVKKEER